MGIFDIQTAPRGLDPRWTVIAEVAGALAGALVAILVLVALF